jgi:hypothetical protein
VIAERQGEVVGSTPLKWSFDVKANADLRVFANLSGPTSRFQLLKPDGTPVLTRKTVFADDVLNVKNAVPGTWTVLIEAPSERAATKWTYRVVVAATPAGTVMTLPQVTNRSSVDWSGTMNPAHNVHVSVNQAPFTDHHNVSGSLQLK